MDSDRLKEAREVAASGDAEPGVSALILELVTEIERLEERVVDLEFEIDVAWARPPDDK